MNIKSLLKYFFSQRSSKIANQQPPHQSPPTTSQELPTTPTNTQTNYSHTSTRISFQDNPYTFEERRARVSEPLEPVIRQAPLGEPQHEPVYNIYPPLQQNHNRARHPSQNQNTFEINRQIKHRRRNRNSQNPRVQFNIPQSPIPNPLELPTSTIQRTPQTTSQQNTSNIPSDYLG